MMMRELKREEAAADAVAAADAAAQQLLDDEAAAPCGKGKAKEWVRLTRRLLSRPSHGRRASRDHINAILDEQGRLNMQAATTRSASTPSTERL